MLIMAAKKYSRQQAIKLSGSTSSRLSYLDSVGLVRPEKIGEEGSKKPVVLYTKEQIDQVKLIDTASNWLNLGTIRLAVRRRRLYQVVESLSRLLS